MDLSIYGLLVWPTLTLVVEILRSQLRNGGRSISEIQQLQNARCDCSVFRREIQQQIR